MPNSPCYTLVGCGSANLPLNPKLDLQAAPARLLFRPPWRVVLNKLTKRLHRRGPCMPLARQQGVFAINGWGGQSHELQTAAVLEVVEMRDVRAALLSTGHNPLLMNADELAQDIVNARKRWAEVIRQTGFKLES